MEVHFKTTEWQKFPVPAELEDKVEAGIKSGEIYSTNSLFEFIEDNGHNCYWAPIEETEYDMTLEENNYNDTININVDGTDTWGNGKDDWPEPIRFKPYPAEKPTKQGKYLTIDNEGNKKLLSWISETGQWFFVNQNIVWWADLRL